MTPPIDYLAFAEWPVRFGVEVFTCIDPTCFAYCGRHGNIAEANHDKECRIAQRNAALQAAHAMQAREQKALKAIVDLPTMDDPDAMCACISDVEAILKGELQ